MKKLNFLKCCIYFMLIWGSNLKGQTITPFLDPSIKFVKTFNSFHLIAESNDSKVWFTTNNTKNTLQFLNADGTLNEFSQEVPQGGINVLASTANNKILVGGGFTSFNNTVVSARILRINPDGTRDFSFSASANTNEVTAIYVLSDGKILVGRNTQIQRLNEDGSTDNTFSTVTTNGKINDFAIINDNIIVAVGDFTIVNGSSKNRIIALNKNGSVNSSFDIGNGFNSTVNNIRKSGDEKLYAIGDFISYKGNTVNRIAKIDFNGNLDSTFHSSNSGFNQTPMAIGIIQNNNLLIGGNSLKYRNQPAKDFIVINAVNGIAEANPPYSFENGMVKHIIKRNNSGFLFSGEFVKYNNDFTYQVFKTYNV